MDWLVWYNTERALRISEQALPGTVPGDLPTASIASGVQKWMALYSVLFFLRG